MGMFKELKPLPEATPTARHAMASMDFSSAAYQKLISASNKLQTKVDSPLYRGDAVAHLGFPEAKIAVYVGKPMRTREERRVKQWQSIGWELRYADPRLVEDATEKEVVAQLQSIIDERRKQCRRK